jgi:hypothetical protein
MDGYQRFGEICYVHFQGRRVNRKMLLIYGRDTNWDYGQTNKKKAALNH